MSLEVFFDRLDPKTAQSLGLLLTAAKDDPGGVDVAALSQWGKRLDRKVRADLVAESARALREDVLRQSELRVFLAKLLISLAPDSMEAIHELLQQRRTLLDFEVHFSLFCFLDRLADEPADPALLQEVLGAVEEYLMTVRAETAMAAWMAGDLLGDHWDPQEALAALLRVLKEARHSAGRSGGIHGLSHLYERVDASQKRLICSALRRASRQDRSSRVRRSAAIALEGCLTGRDCA